MHAPTLLEERHPVDPPPTDPTQLTLFGPPRRRFSRPGPLTTALLTAAGAFALVYAARTFVQGWRDAGDVLDEERFAERSPAHAGYDG